MTDGEGFTMWVTSDVDMDGNYHLTIDYAEDLSITLDLPGTVDYAMEVFTAVAHAEYDAAVLAQMTKHLEMPAEKAAHVIKGLRADRPPLNEKALGVLRLAPGVSAFTGKPFLHISLEGAPGKTWQADPAALREHATYVLGGYPVATLDSAYRRYLVGSVGLDQNRAAATVQDLANWRHE